MLSAAAADAGSQQAAASQPDRQLAEQLLRFITIQCTYGEVEELKTSVAAAERLAGRVPADCPCWAASMQLLLELLFAENSRPLHKQLLAFVRKLPQQHQEVVGHLLACRIQQEAEAVLGQQQQHQQQDDAHPATGTAKAAAAVALLQQQAPLSAAAAQRGLTLAQAAVSLLWLPTAGGWMAPCAPALLLAVASSVRSTLSPAAAGKHLTPNTMELVQDAISALYYTVQQQGKHLAGPAGAQGAAAVAAAADCMLEALQGTALVREAMASAAVVVWAAATLPDVPAAAAAAAFAAGLTPGQLDKSAEAGAKPCVTITNTSSFSLQEVWSSSSLLEQLLQARGSSLVLELQRASPAGRVCALKGLLTAMPAEALMADISCWHQPESDGGSSSSSSRGGVTFIMDCVLSFAVAAARSSPDAHYKFHAVSVVAVALQRALQLWQQLPQLAAGAAAAATAGEGSSEAHQQQPVAVDSEAAAGMAAAVAPDAHPPSINSQAAVQAAQTAQAAAVVPPWLVEPGLSSVVDLLWGNLDEPMAQTLNKVQDAFDALLALLVCQDTRFWQLQLSPAAAAAGAGDSSSSRTGSCGSGSVPGVGSWDNSLGSFLHALACAVLAVAPTRKGRYGPLASMLQWVGAGYLLHQQPGLVHQVLAAMQDDMVAGTATRFLKVLLLQLRREQHGPAAPAAAAVLAAAGGPAEQQQQLQQQQRSERDEQLLDLILDDQLRAWCRWWLPALLDVLWGPDERLRTYVSNHALPVVLQSEPLLLRPIVDMIMAAYAAAAVPAADCSKAAVMCAAAPAAAGAGVEAGAGVANATAALVVVLKVARKMQLVGSFDTLLPQKLQQQQGSSGSAAAAAFAAADAGGSGSAVELQFSPAGLLLSAVSSSSAALRMEALEMACVNARSTEPPGELELALARRWLLLCLRCTGAGSRSKSLVMWDKLLTRQRAAVATIRHRAATAKKPQTIAALAKVSANHPARAGPAAAAAAAASDGKALQRQYSFVRWLSQTLMDSLYPGGPYERKYYALQLLAVLLAQWKPTSADIPSSSRGSSTGSSSADASTAETNSAAAAAAADWPAAAAVMPLCDALLSPAAVQVLLGCLVDTWDKLRVAASSVLERLPSPLPGLEQPDRLQPLLGWALQLTHSPRVRESDAGARLLRLLLIKYVLRLRWRIQLHPQLAVQGPAAVEAASSSTMDGSSKGAAAAAVGADALVQPVMGFLSSLTAQLRRQLALAHADLAAASRCGLVHGIVLALRYAADEVPWAKLGGSSSTASATVSASAAAAGGGSTGLQVQPARRTSSCNAAGDQAAAAAAAAGAGVVSSELVIVHGPALLVLRAWLADLFGLLSEVAQLVQPYLSAQDLNLAADEVEEDGEAGSDADLDDLEELQCEAANAGYEVQSNGAVLSGPAIQLLITACWTSIKEVSLLIGTLARRLPLPGASSSSHAANGRAPQHLSDASSNSDILQPQQLAHLGDLLLSLLLSMKHNGAVEKSQPGFLWLAEQLLQSPRADLNGLPASWLARCLARVQQPGQCRDDVVRRSAGLPFSITCLFLAEPHGVPRQLLPQGLPQLLAAAQDEALPEPWPRVHAFNCLRCVFNDAALAMDTSGFHAAGVAAAIRGMAADAWEVRNAAALTFTALVMRVVGFKNAGNKQLQAKPLQQLAATAAGLNLHFTTATTAAAGSAAATAAAAAAARSSWGIKSPIAADFFYRYPQLHVFLLGQLQEAAKLLQQPDTTAAAAAGVSSPPSSKGVHLPPSLFPVLVILSRLKPSLQLSSLGGSSSSSNTSTAAVEEPTEAATGEAAAAAASPLTPAAFVPAVLAVGRCSIMAVRQIAAASLAPLVAADQLPAMCLELASSLPHDAADAAAHITPCQNVVHGTLLQLAALLRAVAISNTGSGGDRLAAAGSNAAGGAAGANVAALVVHLLPAFAGSSWLGGSGSSNTASGAVRQAYIAAAGQLVILAYTQWPALLDAAAGSSSAGSAMPRLQQLVASLKSSCLAAVQQALDSNGSSSSSSSSAAAALLEAADPQRCCWLRDCTMMLLGHLLRLELLLQQQQRSAEASSYAQELLLQLQQRLPSCMASASYEVRAAALKAAAVQLGHVLQLVPQLPGLLGSGSAAARGLQQLSEQLWAALEHEKTVKVLQRQLVVLGQLQSLQTLQPAPQAQAAQADDAVLQRLRTSLAVARQYKQLEVRIAALTCAAREVRPAVSAACQAAAQSSSGSGGGLLAQHSAEYLQYMQQLLQLVQACSHYGQQEELRAAAADALQLSGLLRPLAVAATSRSTSSSSSSSSSSASSELLAVARLSLSAWSVALRLMEDEEDMVRQPAADAAQQVLQLLQPQPSAGAKPDSVSSSSSSSSSTSRSWGVLADASSSTGQYVEAVEQKTFDMLARCSSWWPDLLPDVLQLLRGVVFEAVTAVPEVLLQQHQRHEQQGATAAAAGTAGAASGVLAGVLVRRLFEKEADNHHEEQVLLAQHAAAALQRTLQHAQLQAAAAQLSPATAAAEGLISSWCLSLVKYLGEVLGKMSVVSCSTAASGGWVGGDTNHPEVFVPLYRCLLGLLAAAPWWADLSSCSSSSSSEQPADDGKTEAGAAAAVKCGVQCMVGQLLQLQPTVLLLPVLRELQRAQTHGVDGAAAACIASKGMLFLTQRQ
ncbi:putative death-receptor fusion protein-domain-containing protein [Scenedesmus sp. NREL 46B-D3]|nr:putative death-receptor fusion protein-domain-containing protein [Scenedesmus sp. NREL 46B-D3]